MGTRVLFDGEVVVHYGQIYVECGDDPSMFEFSLETAFAGQDNGLCGAAVPGRLYLVTGLHTGHLPFRVEVHDRQPPVGGQWEEVVEASFTPTGGDIGLVQWAGEASWPLDIDPVAHRVRYCATGMDNEHTDQPGHPERYLLQFWPEPPSPDRVLKQTTTTAAYWHRTARELAPPPTAEERRRAAEEKLREQRRQEEEWARADEERFWGGRLPTDRLREISDRAVNLARLDRDLVDQIEAAGADLQRQVARWSARRACVNAGLAGLDWVAAALAALDAGTAPPPQAADFDAAFTSWQGRPTTRRVTIRFGTVNDTDPPPFEPEVAALYALIAARADDALLAAVDTAYHATLTAAPGAADVLADLRAAIALPPAHPETAVRDPR